MSPVYDNWGRLVAAAVRKQQIWELFHEQSSISSASSDSSFSFQLNSSLPDVFSAFSISNASASYQKDDSVSGLGDAVDCGVIGSKEIDARNPSSIPMKNQSPVVSGNLSSHRNVSSLPRRKRNLNVQVPKRQFHNDDDFSHAPNTSENYPNLSPRCHPRNGEIHSESPCDWPNYGKQQSFPLPLPPTPTPNSSPPLSHSSLAATSSLPHSPGRMESHISSHSHWKKGELLGGGEYGHLYLGFNSETGELCAMKEVSFRSDDAKSTQTFKQAIQLLSCLKHPNIVQYYFSEVVHDKFYIYLEYVSGGSMDKILKQYGNLGESAIRNYTKQVLAGLAYLHAKHTVHRNIRGATILVDPNGCVKLADFGMAKHGSQIATQSSPLLHKDNLYWMAPEVIRNSNVYNQAVDIWSLGCTVVEMATSKPPWSQYGEAVAMFKIVNCKELPVIPDYLSAECKDFVWQCLMWNPLQRPTAAQLLEHPFLMKSGVYPGNQVLNSTPSDHIAVTSATISLGIDHVKTPHQLDSQSLAMHTSAVSKSTSNSSDICVARNVSSPGSPVGTALQHPRSPQRLKGMLPSSSESTSRASSGSSTPITAGYGGAIQYQRLNQFMLPQDPKCPTSPPGSGLAYWDPNILHRVHPTSHAFRESESSTRYAPGKQFGRSSLLVEKFFMGS
ncbi:mitogen-activated protein kinase kinase kinase YODA-like isoform X2 [Henckelia pumila]|uniref:mitogen-activated protein kinase kinase kinase YODA-like isoform X2 n=1 Tax=Henckelia pumila TaxID=405737 RepID=UPI003C6E0F40